MNQITKAPPKPCILGIVTDTMLAARRWPHALWACGGVEIRADGMNPADIAGAVSDFDNERGRRGFTGPVIFTLRLRRDGGHWDDGAAAARNEVWESLPPGTCDWVDLEIEETSRINPQTLDALRSSGVKILLSHHAFVPEKAAAWPGILDAMRALKPDGVKFAVALSGAPHAEALLDFARGVGSEYPDSCVLGMGPAASLTRLVSPLLGCPYTYGFLGEGAVAPGQLSAEVMTAFFDRANREPGRPAFDASSAAWLAWSEGLLKKVAGG